MLMTAEFRDARTMNHMDPDTRRVHLRLEKWGSATRDSALVSWPKVTMLGRLIEQGPMGAGQAGRPPVSLSEEDAATDVAVSRLGDIDRQAIKEYYQGWMTIDILAKTMRIRVRQAQNILRRARWRLSGMLLDEI